ncbi:hypothetical protein BDV37DRAFT_56440 [Aspergillus pseudonomiae]|uniref:Uncharacterized protein n=1 Tax=Aspergillus pseudonomiae TaxID=1506151 RepID=A0A5N7CTF3_9EURO|nr:uncharacterized protein BDV37DRAFT_56440 [Aspergillus pseudonomiae]KAE8397434.1 hypothetical protein BDV37DRAFT_56440 [Aspergillus pseudonomiae]
MDASRQPTNKNAYIQELSTLERSSLSLCQIQLRDNSPSLRIPLHQILHPLFFLLFVFNLPNLRQLLDDHYLRILLPLCIPLLCLIITYHPSQTHYSAFSRILSLAIGFWLYRLLFLGCLLAPGLSCNDWCSVNRPGFWKRHIDCISLYVDRLD